jgi:hypothetical protein
MMWDTALCETTILTGGSAHVATVSPVSRPQMSFAGSWPFGQGVATWPNSHAAMAFAIPMRSTLDRYLHHTNGDFPALSEDNRPALLQLAIQFWHRSR